MGNGYGPARSTECLAPGSTLSYLCKPPIPIRQFAINRNRDAISQSCLALSTPWHIQKVHSVFILIRERRFNCIGVHALRHTRISYGLICKRHPIKRGISDLRAAHVKPKAIAIQKRWIRPTIIKLIIFKPDATESLNKSYRPEKNKPLRNDSNKPLETTSVDYRDSKAKTKLYNKKGRE